MWEVYKSLREWVDPVILSELVRRAASNDDEWADILSAVEESSGSSFVSQAEGDSSTFVSKFEYLENQEVPVAPTLEVNPGIRMAREFGELVKEWSGAFVEAMAKLGTDIRMVNTVLLDLAERDVEEAELYAAVFAVWHTILPGNRRLLGLSAVFAPAGHVRWVIRSREEQIERLKTTLAAVRSDVSMRRGSILWTRPSQTW